MKKTWSVGKRGGATEGCRVAGAACQRALPARPPRQLKMQAVLRPQGLPSSLSRSSVWGPPVTLGLPGTSLRSPVDTDQESGLSQLFSPSALHNPMVWSGHRPHSRRLQRPENSLCILTPMILVNQPFGVPQRPPEAMCGVPRTHKTKHQGPCGVLPLQGIWAFSLPSSAPTTLSPAPGPGGGGVSPGLGPHLAGRKAAHLQPQPVAQQPSACPQDNPRLTEDFVAHLETELEQSRLRETARPWGRREDAGQGSGHGKGVTEAARWVHPGDGAVRAPLGRQPGLAKDKGAAPGT